MWYILETRDSMTLTSISPILFSLRTYILQDLLNFAQDTNYRDKLSVSSLVSRCAFQRVDECVRSCGCNVCFQCTTQSLGTKYPPHHDFRHIHLRDRFPRELAGNFHVFALLFWLEIVSEKLGAKNRSARIFDRPTNHIHNVDHI